MFTNEQLLENIQQRYGHCVQNTEISLNELTLEIAKEHLHELCFALRDEADFRFEMLIDVCGVDYLNYGVSEWETSKATGTGFDRGVERNIEIHRDIQDKVWHKPRFAVVYHLLSIVHNHRIRLRVFPEDSSLITPSVTNIWSSADWYEREAFDLYGILFDGHPDLRRILTDYGFIGHPFRKDFPLSGNVEVRYDATQQRVIYEPVDIEPRVLVPKVIREGGYFDEIKPKNLTEG